VLFRGGRNWQLMQVDEFIARWRASGGNEIANFQSFASELCDVLGVERPKPAQSDGQTNGYRFERPVTETHTGTRRRRRIDLYRQGCFVMEAKQGPGPKAHEEQLSPLIDGAPSAQLGHGRRGTRALEKALLVSVHRKQLCRELVEKVHIPHLPAFEDDRKW